MHFRAAWFIHQVECVRSIFHICYSKTQGRFICSGNAGFYKSPCLLPSTYNLNFKRYGLILFQLFKTGSKV